MTRSSNKRTSPMQFPDLPGTSGGLSAPPRGRAIVSDSENVKWKRLPRKHFEPGKRLARKLLRDVVLPWIRELDSDTPAVNTSGGRYSIGIAGEYLWEVDVLVTVLEEWKVTT
jgi:hypothetical protein